MFFLVNFPVVASGAVLLFAGATVATGRVKLMDNFHPKPCLVFIVQVQDLPKIFFLNRLFFKGSMTASKITF